MGSTTASMGVPAVSVTSPSVSPAIEAIRQRDVGVVKLHDGEEEQFVKREFAEVATDQRQHGDAKHRGENYFARVETASGGHIHGRISVVPTVKTPEKWHPMVEPVPAIGPGIEHEDRERDALPRDKTERVQQTEAMDARPLGNGEPRGGKGERDHRGVEGAQREIQSTVSGALASSAKEWEIRLRGLPRE